MTETKPYGEWQSPITSDLIVAQSIALGSPRPQGEMLYWPEGRPREGGRTVIVRRDPDGTETDIIPAGFNVRTRVHEYGGDAWLLHQDTIYFCNFTDQQVYRVSKRGGDPEQLTHSPALRFANGAMDQARNRLIYVVEEHRDDGSEAKNYLGAVDLTTGDVTELTSGHDFYSSPTLSPDGNALVWMTWDHPSMPWDDTTLWQAVVASDGTLGTPGAIAGGEEIAVQQPQYDSSGNLYYVSDESGWWNLYRYGNVPENLCPMSTEFGAPHWGFGIHKYECLTDGSILCNYSVMNESRLAILRDGELTPIDLPYTDMGGIHVAGDVLYFLGASPTEFGAIVKHDLATKESTIIKTSTDVDLDEGYISTARAIEFPTANGETAHGFYYPPTNKDYAAPDDEKPPLLVIFHGGPTGATHSSISLRTQYWTSRGFALLDVNYRGSTGYGREYRDRLRLQWGIVDVEDAVHGAEYLVREGKADGDKLAIRGGSAGGYTTLAALAFSDTFTAGASYYGIGDLEALAKDTHKFESRYLDSMIGRYPEDIDVYHARSPIHHVDRLSSATIFFQGLEDKVVPPNQAETMVDALTKKGIPVAYVPFEGEQHGFRKAENIKRSLDLELYFYGRVFGFTPADKIAPIDITNLD